MPSSDGARSRRPAPAPGPVPRPAKPRLLQDGRDMFWSLDAAGDRLHRAGGHASGMCSFQPGRTNRARSRPTTRRRPCERTPPRWASRSGYPSCPADWQSNSGSRGGIENGRTDPSTGQRLNAATSIVGYISSDRHVSEPDPEQRRRGQAGRLDSSVGVSRPVRSTSRAPTGCLSGHRPKGADAEPVWTTGLTGPGGATQIAITGAGSTDQFRTLASATQSQPPLPSPIAARLKKGTTQ